LCRPAGEIIGGPRFCRIKAEKASRCEQKRNRITQPREKKKKERKKERELGGRTDLKTYHVSSHIM